jgi:hypothetical protein
MTGDLATGEGIEAAAEGAEIIVHCAGSGKGDEDKAQAWPRAGRGRLRPAMDDATCHPVPRPVLDDGAADGQAARDTGHSA